MLKMGVDSIDKLKKKLPDLRAELKNEDKFRDVYNFAYMFSREVGQYGCGGIAICKGSIAENGNACYLGAWHLEQLCQQLSQGSVSHATAYTQSCLLLQFSWFLWPCLPCCCWPAERRRGKSVYSSTWRWACGACCWLATTHGRCWTTGATF